MYKPFRSLLSLSALSLLLFSSCAQRLYFPDRANSPGLTEKYEGKVTIAFKPQDIANDHTGLQRGSGASFSSDLAFAPAEHLGLLFSYRGLNDRYITGESNSLDAKGYGGMFRGHRVEFGAGYWDKIGRLGRFEFYGGYGNGSVRRRSFDSIAVRKDFDTRYHRFFVQPALGFGNDIISVMGGVRLAFQKYYDFSSPANPELQYHVLRGSVGMLNVEKEIVAFMEPYVNMEVGYKFVRFNAQIGFSAQYLGAKVAGELPVYMTLGLTFNFAPRYFR